MSEFIKINTYVVKQLPAERPLEKGAVYKVEQPDGELITYTVNSLGEPVFERGITNSQKEKLDGLKSQSEITADIEEVRDDIEEVRDDFSRRLINSESGAVRVDGDILPTLGDANKRYSFTTGSAGRTLTHGATSLVYGANKQCSAFWDGMAKTWTKEDEVELPSQDTSSKLERGGFNGTASDLKNDIDNRAVEISDQGKIARSPINNIEDIWTDISSVNYGNDSGFYNKNTGAVTPYTSYKRQLFTVSRIDNIYLTGTVNGSTLIASAVYFDANMLFLGSEFPITTNVTYTKQKLNPPANTVYIGTCNYNSTPLIVIQYKTQKVNYKTPAFEEDHYNKTDLDTKLSSKAAEISPSGKVVRAEPVVNKSYSSISSSTVNDEVYKYSDGSIALVGGYKRQLFEIADWQLKYAISGVINGAALLANYVMFDANMVFLGYGSRVNTGEIKTYSRFEFNPLPQTKFIGTTNNKSSEPMKLEQVTEISTYKKALFEGEVYLKSELNRLLNKSLLNLGTSIQASANAPAISISSYNNMTLYNKARAGATVGIIEGRNNDIQSQVDVAVSEIETVDYILLDGLANDLFNSVPIGSISTGYTATLDKSTFTGGLEYIFKTLRNKYPSAKIVYIKVHNMGNYSNQDAYQVRASEVCKKWSISIVDLYGQGQLNGNISIMKQLYTNATESQPNGDGIHPNKLGYDLFYTPIIQSILNSL